MITVNENGVRNINASLLSLDSDIKTTKKGLLSKIEALQETVDGMSGGEINLTPGSTYDINITGNASTATNATTADTASQVAGILTLSKTSTKTNETTSDTSFNGLVSVSNKIYSPDQSVNKSDNVTFKSVSYSEENVVTYSMASSVTMPSTDVIYKGIKLTGALTADTTLTLYFNSTTLVGRKSWHILNECTTANAQQTITITTNTGTSTTISVKKNQASYVTDIYVDSSGNVLPFASTRASSSDSLKNPLTISGTALSSATSYNGSSAVTIYSPSQFVNADSMPTHAALKLTSIKNVSPTYSTNDPLVIGTSTGPNIALDNNEIMARNNNVVAQLNLNNEGGPVVINPSASGRTDSFFQTKSTVIIDPLNLPSGGYNEGLRINKTASGVSSILLGGNTNSQGGTQDGAWQIWCNNDSCGRNMYIQHNGTGAAYFYADSSSSGTSGLVIPNVTGNLNGTAQNTNHLVADNALTVSNPISYSNPPSIQSGDLKVSTVYYAGGPATFGNIINMGGSGAGQLFAEWTGTQTGSGGAAGHLYYRSRRDNLTNFTDWATIIDSNNISSQSVSTAETANKIRTSSPSSPANGDIWMV